MTTERTTPLPQPRLFDVAEIRPHPCPYSDSVIDVFARMLPARGLVLDPFAGTGGIHRLSTAARRTIGVELEPEWAHRHPGTIVGNATALPFADESLDAVATSPAFGNRMADGYDGRDGSDRRTYRISLGRELSRGNGAVLQWGPEYRLLHIRAIVEMVRVVRPGGLVLVNVKDHVRHHQHVEAVAWWSSYLRAAGAHFVRAVDVDTDGLRHLNPNHHDCPEVVLVHEVEGQRHE